MARTNKRRNRHIRSASAATVALGTCWWRASPRRRVHVSYSMPCWMLHVHTRRQFNCRRRGLLSQPPLHSCEGTRRAFVSIIPKRLDSHGCKRAKPCTSAEKKLKKLGLWSMKISALGRRSRCIRCQGNWRAHKKSISVGVTEDIASSAGPARAKITIIGTLQ